MFRCVILANDDVKLVVSILKAASILLAVIFPEAVMLPLTNTSKDEVNLLLPKSTCQSTSSVTPKDN